MPNSRPSSITGTWAIFFSSINLRVGRDRIDLIRPPHRRLHRRPSPFIARDGEHVVERDDPARRFALADHVTPPPIAKQEMLDELGEARVARYGRTITAHHLGGGDAGDRAPDREPRPFHLGGVDQEPSEKAEPYAVEQLIRP